MTVADLKRRMGSAEFESWKAYSQLEPFGERRADARVWALIAHASNLMRDPQKGQAVDLKQIMTEWQPAPNPEAMAQAISMFFRRRKHLYETGVLH